MRMLRSARLMLLALLVSLIPASSYAGVFISVGIAPPALPVYVQPVCPEPGLMWTPGYWAYGADGYYWVPGAWVPAPYTGALWTPGYWGWGGGLYAWHPGYWGPHVGYYGGVNYGFGYMGVGFAGGAWRGGVFAYNSAVMRVGVGGGWGGNRVYVDRTVVERTTIINNTHVSYNGGPGGIRHDPAPEERIAEHDQHLQRTSFQTQHESSAMRDHSAYFNNNHGHPANVAMARPLQNESHPAPNFSHQNNQNFSHQNNENAPHQNNQNFSHTNNENFSHPNNTPNHGESYHPAPQEHNAPRTEEHNAPRPQEHSAPRPENHGHDEGHGHGR